MTVADDGPTDCSRKVIACYGEPLEPVFKEGRGQAFAFNVGIACSPSLEGIDSFYRMHQANNYHASTIDLKQTRRSIVSTRVTLDHIAVFVASLRLDRASSTYATLEEAFQC